jgi:FkbM family methyltransferase
MSILVKAAQQILAKVGLRVLWSRNLPRGTEARLYADVNAYLGHGGESAVVLDVGANFGHVTAELLSVFPTLPFHLFEPSPDVFASVENRYRGNPQVTCHQMALSSQPGVMPFQARPDEPGLARLSEKETATTVPVKVDTVDQFLSSHKISKVALMKTDTEGYELEVMAGAQKALQEGRILTILVECAPGEGTHRHVPIRRLMDLLGPYGYELFGLYDFGYRPTGAMHFCNALFKLKKALHPAAA